MGEKKQLQSQKLEIKEGRVKVDSLKEPFEKIVLKKNDSLTVFILPSDGSFSKTLEVFLKGDHSHVEILGVVLGAGSEKSILSIKTVHQGRGTSAYTHVRGALFGRSQSFFSGMIRIEKAADQTSSLLENRVLLLGPGARAESEPSLEIEANEVKASHAATVGRLDREPLFYLRSRGIDVKTATRMMVEGFFEPIFDRLKKVAGEKEFAHLRGQLWVDLLRARL